jgi:carboxypeptidase family protein
MRKRILFVFFAIASGLMAQSETGRAVLEGTVSDPSGKTITSAEIVVRETQTGWRRALTTNAEGAFRASALPVGLYAMEVISADFAISRVTNIALTVGETKTVNITLQVAGLSTEVTVQENAQIVNEADVSNGTSLNERAIEDLPIRGRNFAQFLQLTPNSMQEQNRFGIVVNGQRSHLVNISLDGVDFSDPLQGGQRGRPRPRRHRELPETRAPRSAGRSIRIDWRRHVLDTNVDPTLVNFLTVPKRVDAPPTGVKTPLTGFIFGFDPNYRNPRSGQVALSIEQQIDRNTKVNFGFVRNSTWALQRRIDTNLLAPSVLPNGMPVYPAFDSNRNLVYASSWDSMSGPVFLDSTGKSLLSSYSTQNYFTFPSAGLRKVF